MLERDREAIPKIRGALSFKLVSAILTSNVVVLNSFSNSAKGRSTQMINKGQYGGINATYLLLSGKIRM